MAALIVAILFYMSLNFEICSSAALAFSAKRDFRKESNKEYQWLKRNGLLGQACSHMEPLRRSLCDSDLMEIAKKFDHRRAFKLGDQAAYMAALKRGILDQVCSHMNSDRYRTLSDDEIANIAKQFMSRSEFVKKDSGAYQSARTRGILDLVCAHMDSRGARRLSDSEILDISKQFKTRNDFKLGDFGAYTTAIRRGLIEAACAHMEYGACGFREDRPAIVYQFKVETVTGDVLYKIGITNRKPNQRLATMGLQPGAKAELINFIKFDVGRDARIFEKRAHRKLKPYKYIGPAVMKNGNTELFTVGLSDS